MSKKLIAEIVEELDAFQEANTGLGTAQDPVVHRYLKNLNLLVNRLRCLLRKSS